jgi:hypothetical protein
MEEPYLRAQVQDAPELPLDGLRHLASVARRSMGFKESGWAEPHQDHP